MIMKENPLLFSKITIIPNTTIIRVLYIYYYIGLLVLYVKLARHSEPKPLKTFDE